jgi:folate-binding protein YgfZ
MNVSFSLKIKSNKSWSFISSNSISSDFSSAFISLKFSINFFTMNVVSFIPLLDLKFSFLINSSSFMTKTFYLPNYTSISVKGPDSEKFLQGQISCDISKPAQYFDGLFCNEKGYIISNSVVIKENGFVILVKKDVAQFLVSELEKFSKFYDCTIKIEQQNIYGKQTNDGFTKNIGTIETNYNEQDWETETMKNFCFDIGADSSGKYRINEIGYDFQKFVSYEKGCYRGQEIIARLTYLGKASKMAVVFSGLINSIFNENGREIGKKIFQTNKKDEEYTHFFIEKSEYYSNDNKIITPVASQWDLIQG